MNRRALSYALLEAAQGAAFCSVAETSLECKAQSPVRLHPTDSFCNAQSRA